jgi:hypothetical protein
LVDRLAAAPTASHSARLFLQALSWTRIYGCRVRLRLPQQQ